MEDYNPTNRGPVFVMATTFITCWGGPVCIFVYLMTLIGSHNNLTTAYVSVNTISVLLPLFVFLFRLRMEDSRLFRRSNFKSTKAVKIPLRLILKRYWLRLVGTGGAFFIYDFVNFPNSIMSSTIINSLVPGKAVQTVAMWQLILSLMTLPGVFVGIFLVNRLGRRWTVILGFGGYLLVGLIVGCSFAKITKVIPAFVVMYGLMQSLGHMGPGATLGLVSTESYPTAIRGVCYAISAALGKAGAAVGTEVFTPIKENLGQRWTFFFAAIFGAIGMAVYWYVFVRPYSVLFTLLSHSRLQVLDRRHDRGRSLGRRQGFRDVFEGERLGRRDDKGGPGRGVSFHDSGRSHHQLGTPEMKIL